jgi:hypothetical protein
MFSYFLLEERVRHPVRAIRYEPSIGHTRPRDETYRLWCKLALVMRWAGFAELRVRKGSQALGGCLPEKNLNLKSTAHIYLV